MKVNHYVYVRNASTDFETRYGIYSTFDAAAKIVRYLKSIKTSGDIYIDTIYASEDDYQFQCYDC